MKIVSESLQAYLNEVSRAEDDWANREIEKYCSGGKCKEDQEDEDMISKQKKNGRNAAQEVVGSYSNEFNARAQAKYSEEIPSEDFLKIFKLEKILDNYDYEVSYPYEGVGFYLNLLFMITFKYDKNLEEKLLNIFADSDGDSRWISRENVIKLNLTLPKRWLTQLNIKENLDS